MDTNSSTPSNDRCSEVSPSATYTPARKPSETPRAYGTHPAVETQRIIRDELMLRIMDLD